MGAVGFSFVAFLAIIHGAEGATDCPYRNIFGEDDTMTCLKGCCGSYSNRKCCSLFTSNSDEWSSWSSWSSSSSSRVYSAISTAAIIGIVVGVIILIAIIVGIILCVVCCVKAASPSPSTRGVVMTNPGVAVVSTQGTANRVYVPPPPQAAYPVPPPQAAYPSPQLQAAYPPQPQVANTPSQAAYPPSQVAYPPPQAAYLPSQVAYPPPQAGYPPPQAAYTVPPPFKDASAPPSYESLTTEAKFGSTCP